MQQQQKTMFKVVSPLKRRNGEEYWMRCGTAFTNKDESINIYLDAVPTQAGFHLQLRAYTEEDLQRSHERRSSSAASSSSSSSSSSGHRSAFDLPRNASGMSHLDHLAPSAPAAQDSVPF